MRSRDAWGSAMRSGDRSRQIGAVLGVLYAILLIAVSAPWLLAGWYHGRIRGDHDRAVRIAARSPAGRFCGFGADQ